MLRIDRFFNIRVFVCVRRGFFSFFFHIILLSSCLLSLGLRFTTFLCYCVSSIRCATFNSFRLRVTNPKSVSFFLWIPSQKTAPKILDYYSNGLMYFVVCIWFVFSQIPSLWIFIACLWVKWNSFATLETHSSFHFFPCISIYIRLMVDREWQALLKCKTMQMILLPTSFDNSKFIWC